MNEGKQPLKPRRWLRFSLRTLLLLTAVVACWLGVQVNKAQKQKAAVAAIQAAGGGVIYSTPTPVLARIAPLIGQDFVCYVKRVSFHDKKLPETTLEQIGTLRQLEELHLFGCQITDNGMKYLEPLTQLTTLELTRNSLRDAGIKHLAGMSKMRELNLSSNGVSDEGLQHLANMAELELLNIQLTYVGDEGLQHLRACKKLKSIGAFRTYVSEEGAERLRSEVPGIIIAH